MLQGPSTDQINTVKNKQKMKHLILVCAKCMHYFAGFEWHPLSKTCFLLSLSLANYQLVSSLEHASVQHYTQAPFKHLEGKEKVVGEGRKLTKAVSGKKEGEMQKQIHRKVGP